MDGVRDAYSLHAALYIELFGTVSHVDVDDVVFIERHLMFQRGAVLDVGCGPGHLTEHLRCRDVDATGIDLVPEFIEHARTVHPHGCYELGSMDALPAPDNSVTGILAWYSLIHLPPDRLDGVLAEFRRVLEPGGVLVTGFFDAGQVAAFEHKVVTAWFWPADEFAARFRGAGFTEVERRQRPAHDDQRAHAAIAATGS